MLFPISHDGAASAVARGFYDGLSLRRGGKEPIGGGEGFGRFLFGGRRHVDAFGGHRRHGFFVRGGCGSGGNIRGSGLFGLRDGAAVFGVSLRCVSFFAAATGAFFCFFFALFSAGLAGWDSFVGAGAVAFSAGAAAAGSTGRGLRARMRSRSSSSVSLRGASSRADALVRVVASFAPSSLGAGGRGMIRLSGRFLRPFSVMKLSLRCRSILRGRVGRVAELDRKKRCR